MTNPQVGTKGKRAQIPCSTKRKPPNPCGSAVFFLALLNENEPLSKKRSKKARFYAGFHQFLVQKMLTEQK